MAAIIFDLDGTIADSFDYVTDFLLAAAKLPPMAHADKQELRGLSMAAIARGFGIPWWRLPRLFYSGRRHMRHWMHNVQPFPGMPEVIAKAHAEGHELFVVSSNSVKNVRKFLHERQLQSYFLEMYGGIGLLSKSPTLRSLLREHNLTLKDSVYIGDELRDIEAAQALGMRVIAVSWGFARHQDLAAARPTALVQTPAELLQLIEEL